MTADLGPLLAEHLDHYLRLEKQLSTDPEYVRGAARRGKRQLKALKTERDIDALMVEAGIDLYEELIALANDILAGRGET
ncbi:hypothetical protein [Methylobacterium nodulans]|uniref:Uncharacterized protein n=1 Tax=Methylobacterium nodulans (strain LMG 21967 / CNCM I-2342 / ORS 2060) TaxID=460265 RepID=B8IQQ1_METNO|nr:hypothetical protein [Methylobacterium nodulans]ACL62346.1 hypothetical protein Mnod_7611 [Methylobacterium nodulans ORS 2060]